MRLEELHDFELTKSQKMVRAMARDFARKEVSPYVLQWERDGQYPREIVTKMGNLGFMGAFIPEEYGGSGLDYLSYGLICEEVAYADWVCASIISVQKFSIVSYLKSNISDSITASSSLSLSISACFSDLVMVSKE